MEDHLGGLKPLKWVDEGAQMLRRRGMIGRSGMGRKWTGYKLNIRVGNYRETVVGDV